MARLERPGDEPSLSQQRRCNGCVMQELGKILAFFGVILLVLGAIFLLLGRTTLPIGRLPGDILYRGKNTTFYFPLTTSLLLSVVLSLALYLVNKLR